MTTTRARRGWRRWLAGVAMVLVCAAGAAAFQEAQDEFKPATQLGEQLPGAPFVFVAYAFCWVAIFGYVLLLWQRLGRLQRELADVNARLKRQT
jgi:CcmD family protein